MIHYFPLRLLRIISRKFIGNHLPMKAAALTFSIIQSMVPILALSTSIFKSLGNDQQLKLGINHLIDQWEPIHQTENPKKRFSPQDLTEHPRFFIKQYIKF